MISIKDGRKTKYQVGEQFIITIAEISEGAESKQPIYRIEGFDTLTLNDRGLDRLQKLSDKQEEDEMDHLKWLARAFAKGYSCGERETKESMCHCKKKAERDRLKAYYDIIKQDE